MDKKHKSNESFQETIKQSPLPVFMTNSNGEYTYANQAAYELTGYSCSELIGMKLTMLFPTERTDAVSEIFNFLKYNLTFQSEIKLQKKDHQTTAVTINAIALSDESYLAFCTDINGKYSEEDKALLLNCLSLKQ